MATEELVKLLQQQLSLQNEQMQAMQLRQEEQQLRQEELRLEQQKRQEEQQLRQEKLHQSTLQQQQQLMQQMLATVQAGAPTTVSTNLPTFSAYHSTEELWSDYWARFLTFLEANSVPADKAAKVFLTSQSPITYKLLSNIAAQDSPPTDINALTLPQIEKHMKEQFDPRKFTIRERFKFWKEMSRKPGETIPELAARIRQDAIACDFSSIKDPLDEALRTRFICSISNEAVLKALLKCREDELTFADAIQIANEVEDATKAAKETVSGAIPPKSFGTPLHKVQQNPSKPTPQKATTQKPTQHWKSPFPKGTCSRCGKTNHRSEDCRYKNTICKFCKKAGHLEKVCLTKNPIRKICKKPMRIARCNQAIPQPVLDITVSSTKIAFEIDTGAGDNFISERTWELLGKPTLSSHSTKYESASQHDLPVLGAFTAPCSRFPDTTEITKNIQFVVTSIPRLDLLGREAIRQLNISVDALIHESSSGVHTVNTGPTPQPNIALQQACKQVCEDFPDLFKPELGCLKGVELEVQFKPDAKPKFCKPRAVPLALQEDLAKAYDAGIAKGVWEPVQFNEYGTPVVPVRKAVLPGQTTAAIRVCGDYSTAVNSQLEAHRQPMPLPEDLMRSLGGGHGFSKIDLADAYNQVPLAPSSQKKLALSTHRGVLLQKRLPFGISSATGYFQEIMHQLTGDLPGVAVYLDDILVSGANAEEHLQNLRRLLSRLNERGLRCRLEKCAFAQPSVEYLGHHLSQHGISKGSKVDAVMSMPEPENVTQLRSYLSSVQFYGKFLPDLATVTEPLHRLTRKNIPWKWEETEREAFQKVQRLLSEDTVLAHYDPSLPIGISCDASDVGLGAVLFHRYPDGSERPIANASKTLTPTQRNYAQVQKEALSIIFAIKKFYQFLYGRHFILVTDHKPLLSLFGPATATPSLAANRLARWALMLNQFSYSIEYRRTADHGNADALSRLPIGPDDAFDREEGGEDHDTICTIHTISTQIEPTDPKVMVKESAADPVISSVMRYIRDGWPRENADDTATTGPYRKIVETLSVSGGCLFNGSRLVIPPSQQPKVLQLLHQGHFGIQRMKQLARTAVYWPNIDKDIVSLCQQCTACAENQNKPKKEMNHPWMMPEKPWSRLHIDHAINFMGSNWLVLVDSYSKYPCIHPTQSTSTKATTELLEENFAHFGYPHTLVTDNATTFTSAEFQQWCADRGITHLTGAPYHPATNGAAERLVQTFKQALRKSDLPPRRALPEFLQQYRRMPLSTGFSPSELLNGRQIRTRIDALLPTHAHLTQKRQTLRAPGVDTNTGDKSSPEYKVGTLCYALCYSTRHGKEPRWVPATVTKRSGERNVSVRILPDGPIWRRHIEQLRPRHTSLEDDEPPIECAQSQHAPNAPRESEVTAPDAPNGPRESGVTAPAVQAVELDRSPEVPEYGPHNLRRSRRPKRPVERYGL